MYKYILDFICFICIDGGYTQQTVTYFSYLYKKIPDTRQLKQVYT